MQLISDSSLSAWSSQVNFLISEWCSLPLPHRHTHTHITPQSKSWTALKADHLGWKHKSVEECRKENGTWRFANCYFWFQRAPVELALLIFPSLRLWLTTPHPPHLLHVSDIKLRIFTSSRDKFTVGGREKASLPPKLIFPSNILQEELLEVECEQVGRLSNRLR